jgi:hypothetical protein
MIEGLSLEIAEYHLGDQVSSQQTETLSNALSAIDGVESAEIHNSSVSVQYYPDILSKETIRRELVGLGVSLEKNGKPRNPFKRFVNRLAESNAKTFGSEPLDCCNLNSKQRLKS